MLVARRVRRLDEPPAPHPGDRARRRACARPTVDDWRAGQPRRAAPRRRPAERPGEPPDGPRLPGRRRARGDAPPPAARPARTATPSRSTGGRGTTCSTSGRTASAGTALRERLREQDGVDPDDVICPPERAPRAGHDLDGLLSRAATSRPSGCVIKSTAIDPRQPRRRRRLPHDRARARVHDASATRSRRSRGTRASRSMAGDVIVLAGRGPLGSGHGGDVPGHVRAAAICRGRARSRSSPTRGSPASRPARASGTSARRRSRAGRSASSSTATSSGSSSTAEPARRPSTSSATATRRGRPRRRAAVLAEDARRTRRSRRTRLPADTRALGARCRRSAAACGAGASTTSSRSLPRSAAGAVDTAATDNRLSGSLS